MDVAKLTADPTRLGHIRPKFPRLIVGSPERRADGHGCDLSAGILEGVRFAGHLVLFGETRVEDSAEVHIAAVSTGPDDDALARADVHRLVLAGCRNSYYLPC